MNKIISLLAVIMLIMSCSKKSNTTSIQKGEVQNGIPSFQSLLSFLNNTDVNGTFILQNNTLLGQTDFSKITTPININGTFFASKVSKQTKAGGEVKFGKIAFNCQNNSYNKDISFAEGKDLFGKTIEVSLTMPTLDNPSNNLTSALLPPMVYQSNYVPQLFICTTPIETNVHDASGNYISGTKIYPGSQLSWDIDPKNEKGVFIFFEYSPNDPANQQLTSSFGNRAANGVLVEDNGYYILPADMFTDIPLNAKIDVYIGRGNFQYFENADNNDEVQFTSLTYQYGHLWYKRPL